MSDPARFIPQQPARGYDSGTLWREFQKIREMSDALADPTFDIKTEEPSKPKEGMLRYADGTEWDPGSGAGLYVYDGAKWVALNNAARDRVSRFFLDQM